MTPSPAAPETPTPTTPEPTLAEVARRTANLLGDAGQANNRIRSIRAKIRAYVDGVGLRADLDADLFRLFGLLDLAGQELRSAIAAEEDKEKRCHDVLRRILSVCAAPGSADSAIDIIRQHIKKVIP